MNNNRGFTMLEVAVATFILGIMAAFVVMKFQKTIASKNLEMAANNLYLELRSLRPLSFKYDANVIAKFTTTPSSQCTIYIDTNHNDIPESNELIRVHKIPEPISIGLASTYPSSMPFPDKYGEDWTPPSNGLFINWKTSIQVIPDSRGEYNHGGVCLSTPKLNKTSYFIGITWSMQSIEFYKSEGTSWSKL